MLSKYIPDVIHPFSFILLTSAFFNSDKKKAHIAICLWWLFINMFFEVGQLFKETYIKFIPVWFHKFSFFEAAESYFINGTYDRFDLLSITAGVVMAYFVLILTKTPEEDKNK
jgi:hypothetical protein